MSSFEPNRSSLYGPGLATGQPRAGGVILPPIKPLTSTDGAMLMREARTAMLSERINSELAQSRLYMVYEMRRQQQEQAIAMGQRAMRTIEENQGNPLVMDAVQTSFYDWLQESRAVIRYAAERGW